MQTTIALTLELHHNNRVTSGLLAVEDHFVEDYGWAVIPGPFPGKDRILVTLANIDLGRFDSEGEMYLCKFLNILPGDFISWVLDEAHS